MTLRQALKQARDILAANNIEDSSLESELLLRHILQIDRVRLYLDIDRKLSPDRFDEFWTLVQRRLEGEPSAYITGKREFYGLDFYVDSSVLIPRPETELLVERALELAGKRSPTTIADIGTGCGAIAISLALNLTRAKIYAVDVSVAALEVAAYNCRKHGVVDRVILLQGDMLELLPCPVDIIVANLPYVREDELTGVNTHNYEPALAMNGGVDGVEKIKKLCQQISGKLRPGGSMLLEIGQGQAEAVTEYLHDTFKNAEIGLASDLAGIERVVSLSLPRIT